MRGTSIANNNFNHKVKILNPPPLPPQKKWTGAMLILVTVICVQWSELLFTQADLWCTYLYCSCLACVDSHPPPVFETISSVGSPPLTATK